MQVEEILGHLGVEGYCVVEGVIPADEIDAVRESVAAAMRKEYEAAMARSAEVRAKGHRIGGAGVQAVPGIINLNQSFAPYLVDARLIGAVQALFGDFHRITNISGMVNHPGNDRGYWHADWPYNQTNAAHIPAPYADAVSKLSSLWMLTEFSPETGGTLVLPGSHRAPTNPSGGGMIDREAPHPAEVQVSGSAGSVVLLDSRLWHCVAVNQSRAPRLALNVGYAPWWLNLQPTREGSEDYQAMVVERDGKPNKTPPVPRAVYEDLPDGVQPLLRHWVAE